MHACTSPCLPLPSPPLPPLSGLPALPSPDLALYQPAFQSSTYWGSLSRAPGAPGSAGAAVDGITMDRGLISNTTDATAQPWWYVDLGGLGVQVVGAISVFNLADGCAGQCHN